MNAAVNDLYRDAPKPKRPPIVDPWAQESSAPASASTTGPVLRRSRPAIVDPWAQPESAAPAPSAPSITRPGLKRTLGEAAVDRTLGIGAAGLDSLGSTVRTLNQRTPLDSIPGGATAFTAAEAATGIAGAVRRVLPDAIVPELADRNLERARSTLAGMRAADPNNTTPRSEFAQAFADKASEYAGDARGIQSEKEKVTQQRIAKAQEEGFFPALKELVTNPSALATATDSLPSMLAAGGGAGGLVRGLTTRAGVGAAAAGRLATGAQLGTMATLEGAGAGDAAFDQVMQAKQEVLDDDPAYLRVLEQTKDPARARQVLAQMARSAAMGTGTASSLALMGLGEKFGLNVVEDAMLGKALRGAGASRIGNALVGGAREFAGEAAEGAANQLSQNVGAVLGGVEDDPFRGVGGAAAMEGVVGAVSGGVRGLAQPVERDSSNVPNSPQNTSTNAEPLALPPPTRAPITVGPDGVAFTPAQRQEMEALGLTPDVLRAQAQREARQADAFPDAAPGSLADAANAVPQAAPTLPDGSPIPDPANGPLSRAVNDGAANGGIPTGFRTWENMQTNITLDAHEARQRTQREREMDEIARQSRLPAALYDAEVTRASGRDDVAAAPTAMQLAMQRAQSGTEAQNMPAGRPGIVDPWAEPDPMPQVPAITPETITAPKAARPAIVDPWEEVPNRETLATQSVPGTVTSPVQATLQSLADGVPPTTTLMRADAPTLHAAAKALGYRPSTKTAPETIARNIGARLEGMPVAERTALVQKGLAKLPGSGSAASPAVHKATDGGDVRGFAEGSAYATASGRTTTQVPKLMPTTTVARLRQWTMENALAEAQARGDDFNAQQFADELRGKPQDIPQASIQAAEEYLFGEQPPVPAGPKRAAAQAVAATHTEPGQAPQPATSAVVAESAATVARAPNVTMPQAKKNLLSQIETAMQGANADAWPDIPEGRAAQNGRKQAAENERDRITQAAGFVTFDVPGDGTFRVVNNRSRLEAFRQQVNSQFKNTALPVPKLPSTNPSEAERTRIMAEAETVDDGDVLFSRASVVQGQPNTKGLPVENVERIAQDFMRRYRGNIPLEVKVGRTLEHLYGPNAAKLGNAKGAYHARNGLLILAADRLSSRADVETTLRHEVLGHYGLNTLAPADKRAVLDAILTSRTRRSLAPIWAEVDALYSDMTESVRAEEVFAELASRERGTLGEWWDAVLSLLAKGLRNVGLLRGGITKAELHDLARRIADGIRSGRSQQQTFPASDQSQFNRTRMPKHLNDAQRDALDKIGTFATPESLPKRVRRVLGEMRRELVQGVFDQFQPIKALDGEAYMQARLSRGTDGTLESLFLHGTPILRNGAFDVQPDGHGLRGVLAELKGEHDLFLAWIAGNRAADLKMQGREHLFSGQQIEALKSLNQGTMPDGTPRATAYRKALAEYNRYQKAVLDIGQQAGLFSAKSRSNWESEFYIPFFRDFDAEQSNEGAKFAEVGTQKVIQQLEGGAQPLGDLLTNVLENHSRILTAAMRNLAADKALAAAEKDGIAVKTETGNKDTHRVMREGAPVHYRVNDPMLVDALTMLHFNGDTNKTLRVLGTFKRVLSFGVTIGPGFRIRNLLRDSISAMATADAADVTYNPLKQLVAGGSNLKHGWKAAKHGSPTFQRLLAGGGAVRFGALNDGAQSQYARRLIDTGIHANQILDTPAKLKRGMKAAYQWWQDIGDRAETVNRAVIYERAIKAGKNHPQASYEARDLLDFTAGGKWAAVRFLAQTVPFLNARLQGLYKLGRAARNDFERFATVTGTVALASALLYLLQKDDEEYQALPDWARDGYWCINLGGTMLFLPKPFEIGALGTVVERGTELMLAGDDYQARDFGHSVASIIVDQLQMNPVPQAVRPLLEVAFNRDTFRGRPIDSMGQERLPAEDRHTARTSAAAVVAGQALNVSPNKIEHLVKGYFGWLGVQALNVADIATRPATSLPSNPARDMTSVTNWPVAGEFLREASSVSSKYVERFYEAQRQNEELYAAYSAARAANDIERAMELESTDAVSNRKLHNLATRQMQEVNRDIRRVTADPTLDASEKSELLGHFQAIRNQIAQRVDQMTREREGAER